MPINKPTVIPPHPLIDRAPPGDLPWPEPPTDDLGTRLAWAAALAGLLSLAPLLLWLVKLLIDWGMVWPALIVCGALAGVLTGIGWIVQRIRLDMRAARWYAGARRRAVSSRLATVAAFWDATVEAGDHYSAKFYGRPRLPGNLTQVVRGDQVYWLDRDGKVWRRARRRGDNSTQASPVEAARQPAAPSTPSRDTTQHLDTAPEPPELTEPQSTYLTLIVEGKAYGWRRIAADKLMTRPEFDAVTSAFLAAEIIFKNDGQTHSPAPELARWRELWQDAAGHPDAADRQTQITGYVLTWARRRLAGL